MSENKHSERSLIIWGASGHAWVVADLVVLDSRFALVGFIDDLNPVRHGTEILNAPVLGDRSHLKYLLATGVSHCVVAIGNCEARLRLSSFSRDMGFELPTLVHPRACVASSATLGSGTVVAASAVINPAAQIGNDVIINAHATVEHECRISDGVAIGPGATLAGRVQVGRGTFVGAGTTVRDGITIGSRSVVGAGAVVVKDIPDGVITYGVPARISGHVEDSGEEHELC